MTGIGRIASPVSAYIAEIFGQRQGLRQQGRFLDAVSRTSPQELSRAEVTAEVQAARNERFALAQYLFDAIAAVSSVVSAVGVCVAVFTIDVVAGVWVMAAICPVLVVASWSSRLVDETWTQLGESQRRSEYAIEQLVSQRTGTELAIMGTAPKLAELAQKHLARYNARFRSMRLKTAVADVMGAVVTAGFLAAALLSLVSDAVDGGVIAAGIMGVIAGVSATSSAGNHLGALVRDAPKAARFYDFITSVPLNEGQTSGVDVSRVEAREVCVDYGVDRAVEHASVEASKGEMVALVGPNGSGKTSLLNGILGVVDIASGDVLLDGMDAAALSSSERLSRFAHMAQEFGR